MRTFALWVFGLLASAIFGGVIGVYMDPYGGTFFFTIPGCMFAFACARLWVSK